MLDEPLMLQVNLLVVATIHPESNKFFTGVKIKATGDPKLNDNLGFSPPFFRWYCNKTMHMTCIPGYLETAVSLYMYTTK